MSVRRPVIDAYRHLAADAAAQAHVPYSKRPEAVVLVLDDGCWVPGVRVESGAFSLTIAPLLNAATTAVALNAGDVRAIVASRPFHPRELTFSEGLHALAGLTQKAADVLASSRDLPEPGERISPFVSRRDVEAIRSGDAAGQPDPATPATDVDPREAVMLARRIAARAHVPESDFPVGCLLEIEEEGFIPGVNVEHEDWMHILCAERNALGTAISYGFRRMAGLYLTCLRGAGCTPCGACRQLLAELAPTSTLWMDGGNAPPAASDLVALLPGFFDGMRLFGDT